VIEITQGNVILADAEALVNTVNCVGHMGRGIALQFKQAFPDNFTAYAKACRSGQVVPGRMFVFATGSLMNPRYIINFPTKRHWRGQSRLSDIESGLAALVDEIRRLGITSVAVPPLGCGLGGLDWRAVRPRIEEALSAIPGVRVTVYEPAGAPDARSMPVATQRPHMTEARALVIRLVERYAELAYRLTLLEIQKLAYFLQEAGEPLRLAYGPGLYGPYAPNLGKVLEVMEGHFLRGYGDNPDPDAEVELLPGAAQEAGSYLRPDRDRRQRLDRVAQLTEGFETPYGMELLSSVHWVATHGGSPARSSEEAVNQVHAWSDRKRRMFRADHIRIAWQRLQEMGWLPVSESGQSVGA
jgi:O-acetyl-ADP-ribose deacetylase (regulator of RNase III)